MKYMHRIITLNNILIFELFNQIYRTLLYGEKIGLVPTNYGESKLYPFFFHKSDILYLHHQEYEFLNILIEKKNFLQKYHICQFKIYGRLVPTIKKSFKIYWKTYEHIEFFEKGVGHTDTLRFRSHCQYVYPHFFVDLWEFCLN